jgi:hypothetical protein
MMSFEYWFMFPISVLIAITANSSGFSGGVLFQPIMNIFLQLPIQTSVATGIATETVGMTSGAIRYIIFKMADLPIGFTMIMLTIPGVVVGNHILLIIPGDLLKMVLGIIIFGLASIQLTSAVRMNFGTKDVIPIEEIYPFIWMPPLGGLFSASTGTGICEMSQPILEKGMGLKTKRANATAILIEATGDWIITILNLHAGLILWELWIFTGSGVIIGGQIGPYVARYLPERLIKIVFSVCVLIIAVFYMYKGYGWLMGVFS